jgi:hypothetical protein
MFNSPIGANEIPCAISCQALIHSAYHMYIKPKINNLILETKACPQKNTLRSKQVINATI